MIGEPVRVDPEAEADAVMPARPRSLAAAVVAIALAVVLAACQSGGGSEQQPSPAPPSGTEQVTVPQPEDTVFLGESAAHTRPISVPAASVGEPATRDFAISNSESEPKTVQELSVTTDNGEAAITEDNCSGVELPPGGGCTITLQHVAAAPGSYSGQLTAETTDGQVITVEITGEAVDAAATPDGSEESPSSSPTADDTPTDDTPTDGVSTEDTSAVVTD
ncbi:hypothetical protein [Streptomyces sp. NPDC090445]|uniref:hypothetical protein n=1 Tax=Streptomyces sp. NPDC090445 TaxID=3365963 RepID=UPI0037F8E498